VRTPQGSCIAYYKPKPQVALRIFCFPYAGGGATVFRSWAKLLPDTIELCPVQLPGRQTRATEPACSRIEPLIDLLSAELIPFLGIPYVFFGYSMGALIAFDLARRFRAESVSGPLHLFLAARRGPRLPDPYPRIDKLAESELITQLATLGGTPREVLEDPELLQIVLPTFRADFALCENYTYRPGGMLDCPLTVFGGKYDSKVPMGTLAAWGAETTSSCKVKIFEGDHFFIHTCRTELLQTILEDLSTSIVLSQPRLSSLG
jgi:medium-chain acyl-[acyl-carrier-protein] hydrolase